VTEFEVPESFNQPRLVLVEGSDDEALISGLVGHLGLSGFQCRNMKGKDAWPDKLRAIAADPTFRSNVLALGLVRDADQNPTGTWQSCKSAIEGAQMVAGSAPGVLGTGSPATCVAILPHYNNKGAIEELCLESFPPELVACVDSYFACVDTGQERQTRSNKAYVQAYLAGQIPLRRNLQIAAASGSFNFDHPAFSELSKFLVDIHSVQASSQGEHEQ
jgi:uncharacterized protein DUF3226